MPEPTLAGDVVLESKGGSTFLTIDGKPFPFHVALEPAPYVAVTYDDLPVLMVGIVVGGSMVVNAP